MRPAERHGAMLLADEAVYADPDGLEAGMKQAHEADNGPGDD